VHSRDGMNRTRFMVCWRVHGGCACVDGFNCWFPYILWTFCYSSHLKFQN